MEELELLDFVWLLSLWLAFGLEEDEDEEEDFPVVGGKFEADGATIPATGSFPKTLSDCVTIVSTKFELVNLLDPLPTD